MQYGNTGSYHININYQENVALNVIYFQYACILFIGLKLIIYVYHLIKYFLFMDRRKCFFLLGPQIIVIYIGPKWITLMPIVNIEL